MTKIIFLLVALLSVFKLVDAVEVQCVNEAQPVACGLTEGDPCDAKIKNNKGDYEVGDLLKVTYDIATPFQSDLCDEEASGSRALTCAVHNAVVYVQVSDVGATVDLDISQGAAEVLCPENCLFDDGGSRANAFSGICQSGEAAGSKCENPEGASPRVLICSVPLGSDEGAVVSVECVSGPSCTVPPAATVVQCANESPVTACGKTEEEACDAKIKGTDTYDVNDILKITYEIATSFQSDLCDDDGSGGDKECAAYSETIFVKISDTGLSADIIEISQGGAEALCPENCLYDDGVTRADAFSGICQPGAGLTGNPGKSCVQPEDDDPRTLICSAALGSNADAVVTVECHSGPTCPEDESSTAEPEDESSTADPEEESSTESTSTGIDGGSAFALTSGAAALYASLLVVAMHEA